jgi:D-tyrosyl-tRNA(Tyr) deacylase
VILVGIHEEDTDEDLEWLASKIAGLRIFSDESGKMNAGHIEAGADFMVISQFTLHASVKKGNRPSFISSAKPELALPLYLRMIDELGKITGKEIRSGEFGAMMDVELVNEGPVTLIIDTKNRE